MKVLGLQRLLFCKPKGKDTDMFERALIEASPPAAYHPFLTAYCLQLEMGTNCLSCLLSLLRWCMYAALKRLVRRTLSNDIQR